MRKFTCAFQKVLYSSVFPMLQEQLNYPDMLVLVLPALVAMVENASDDDYKNIIQPEFKQVFNMARPVQVCKHCIFCVCKSPKNI